ncbi:Uncharacterised protein [Mycobacteroides abscessus subsp. abscessus]|nr:Uncharacterised protein [Mycobacteroides abscessus subsp. abscessus]
MFRHHLPLVAQQQFEYRVLAGSQGNGRPVTRDDVLGGIETQRSRREYRGPLALTASGDCP